MAFTHCGDRFASIQPNVFHPTMLRVFLFNQPDVFPPTISMSFLDALASLDLLSVSQSLIFFGFPVIPVIPVIPVMQVMQ